MCTPEGRLEFNGCTLTGNSALHWWGGYKLWHVHASGSQRGGSIDAGNYVCVVLAVERFTLVRGTTQLHQLRDIG